jgi:sec-independent protein translocase protein TatA
MAFISAPGPLEMMVILVVALLVLGPQRLPEVARSVGRGMRELKDSLSGVSDDDYADELEEERPTAKPVP